jgi:response regulator RpfG family c-di-GMP phosphodiesterase
MKPTKLKMLFVDDEPHILEGLSQLFDLEYDVHTANSGAEAIAFVKETPDLAIVISDQRMPQMKGIDVLKNIKAISPDTIRILLTGYADADAILDSVNVGEVFRYVKKPWQPENLKSIVSLAAATYTNRSKMREKNEVAPTVQEPTPKSAISSALNELQKQQTTEEKFFSKLSQKAGGDDAFEKVFHGETNKPKILVVDDEQGVLTALSQLLSDAYDVITCKSADEAIARLNEDSFVTLLLTDQRMPKKTGTDLLIESRDFAPLVPKILITAYTDVEDIIRLINEGQIFRYIQKPWNPEKLRETIMEAVELYRYQVTSKLGATPQEQKHNETVSPLTMPTASGQKSAMNTLAALSELAKRKSEVENA